MKSRRAVAGIPATARFCMAGLSAQVYMTRHAKEAFGNIARPYQYRLCRRTCDNDSIGGNPAAEMGVHEAHPLPYEPQSFELVLSS